MALRVFLPFALGYYFSYLVRNVNAVIAPNLVGELGLTAASLGLLTSVYFFAFAAFQLPLGVLLDRYGPRRVESVLLLFAAAGSALFALSDEVLGLTAGRALIGLGVSAGLMAAFKANTLWIPPERTAFVNGCVMSAGGLGALSATAPVEALLGIVGWRGVFWMLALIAALAAVSIHTVVPRRAEEAGRGTGETLADALRGVAQVFSSRAFWRVLPASTLAQASFMSIQGLWVGPWLMDVARLDQVAAAQRLFWIAVAMIAGFFTLGAIASRFARHGLLVPAGAFAAFMLTQLALILVPVAWTAPLWLLFGYFGTCGILYYSYLSGQFPTRLSGRVVTGLNVFTFAGAFLCQWGMGVVIERWPGSTPGSYLQEGYRAAFASVLILQALSFACLLLVRERKPVAG
jgi:predicted MFS family arabinose efflux permease